jgi:hypothetical protein
MRLIFGEEVTPQPIHRENDADNLWGPAWYARRDGDRFILEYDTGSVNGRMRSFDIAAEEFERLRADPNQFMPIVYAHGG